MSARTYYMVLYDDSKSKGAINAMPSILDEETARVMLQEANPTVDRKKGGMKFQVLEKRLFEYKNVDGSTTLFIIADVKRIK